MTKKIRGGGFSKTQLLQAIGTVPLPEVELEGLLQTLSRRWPSVLRHRREISPDELPLPTEPVDWYRLARRGDQACGIKPSRCLAYAAGDYYLQDAGSLLALAVAGADADFPGGQLICDLCAAPGGKATALLEAIGDSGFLLANEPIRSRIPALQFNLARSGSDRFAVSCLDPQELADRLGGVFDVVLVDAPCSGQTLVSRGRQSASSWSQKQIAHSAARQARILDAATALLRQGGRLIYSTCTFAEPENEAQVRRLIAAGKTDASPLNPLQPYESFQSGCYRLWPHRHQCAGSFAASMVQLAVGSINAPSARRSADKDKPPVDLTVWFDGLDDSTRLRTRDSIIVGWPAETPQWVDQLAISGPELAHRTGQTWKPSHAAALRRVGRGRPRESFAVDSELAGQFMTGQTVPCDRRGWQVVTWTGRPLGWCKANGSIGKNHLPAAARISGEIIG